MRQISISSEGEQFADKYAIITLPQMADALSHAMRRESTVYYDVTTLNRIYVDNETGAPIALSNDDIQIIKDLIAAHRIFGHGEFWTWKEFNLIKNEPRLKFNLSQVVSNSDVSDASKKTMPRNITTYNISGIAMNNQDKYSGMRKQTQNEKRRYRRPNQNTLFLSLDSSEKKELKAAAKVLGISVSEMVMLLTMPTVRGVISDGKKRKSEQIQAMKAAISG